MGLLPTNANKSLFVSWTRYTTRSVSFAEAWGADYIFCAQGAKLGMLKYIPRGLATVGRLLKDRPALVFAMNPPYFLPLLIWFYCLLFRARYVLDSHTAAFDSPKWTPLMFLHRFAARRAVVSVVTNEQLAETVRALGGRAIVLSDIPYTMPEEPYSVKTDTFRVVFICTFAPDEPLMEMFQAARNMPDVTIYVTGNASKAPQEIHEARPENVRFTGFISPGEYGGLLRQADAIMVLTTRDFTMQRGGSEAVTVGKPLITSDWPLLRDIFHRGTEHVDNTAGAIEAAVRKIQSNPHEYAREIAELADERQQNWDHAANELKQLLAD
jgi:glycosyltransferase involved in cell wall biosynthesis